MNQEFEPAEAMLRYYPEAAVGGFPHTDGEIEFYLRVGSLVGPESRVLDLGAGRGQWAIEPAPATRRDVRRLKGRVREVIGTDVDPAVLDNPTLDRALVTELGAPLPFEDDSFDLVIADYVLEHVAREDVDGFLATHGLTRADIGFWVAHPGGPKVLEAMAEALELPRDALGVTWDSLDRIGNLSSASVLHVLADTLRERPPHPGSHGVLMAMGPGFCLEMVLLRAAG